MLILFQRYYFLIIFSPSAFRKRFLQFFISRKTKVKIILNAIRQERETAKKVFCGIDEDIILCTFSLTGLISEKQKLIWKNETILDALHNKFPKKSISNYTHHLIGDLSKRLKNF